MFGLWSIAFGLTFGLWSIAFGLTFGLWSIAFNLNSAVFLGRYSARLLFL